MLVTSIALFLLLSALFSGTEIAFISASKLGIELKKKKGSRRGRILAQFYEKPADFLGTMLVGNNIALVVFTYLMTKVLTPIMIDVLPASLTNTTAATESSSGLILLINTIIITVVVLIFGEFLPKTLFRLYADQILYFLAYPLQVLKYILLPPAWLMTTSSTQLLRLIFKTPQEEDVTAFTRLDLENFISNTRTDSEEEIDKELFGRALNLKEVRVRDCMVPRTEIENLDVSASIEELIQLFKETKHSRIIITKDEIDNVLGYVHHQKLLEEPKSIRRLIMPLSFVPEVMRVTDLMNTFVKKGNNIACVVDEFGGVSGLITLEDILEEIFGEIEDEHDQEEYVEIKISDTEFIFSGRLEIDYLNEKYEELELPEGDYHTLSGYLVTTTETIPEQGAIIELEGYQYILELVSNTKIETIRVLKLVKEEEGNKD